MKYALSISCLSFLFIFSPTEASARSITSLNQSYAISAVVEFMYDVGEDLQESTRLTDKKINLKDFSNCINITSVEVLDDVDLAIRKVMRFYPDDEIPFEEALNDLEDYLDHQSYKKCTLVQRKDQSLIKTSYYVNSNDKIHLRLDNIALVVE